MSSVVQNLLLIGFGLLFAGGLAIWGLLNAFVLRDEVSERLGTYAFLPEETPRGDIRRRRTNIARWRLRLNNMLSALASEELGLQILSANWPITETEFMLIRFWVTGMGLVLGWLLFQSPISGVGLAVIAYILPGIYLSRSINNRRLEFGRQLIDILVLITGAVRAGYSLQQAFEVVVKEMKPPASEEFRRVTREIGLGLPLSQALTNLTARMQSDDLYLVTTAIKINAKVGGNLTSMLDAVTKTIRERIRLFGELRALTAQQRFGSYLLTVLPFGLGGILFFLNPNYMERLFEPGIYLCIPFGALINVVLGNIIIRRLAKIDV